MNDQFLTVTGAGQIDYHDGPPVFVFGDLNMDWSNFKEWNHLAMPDDWVCGGENAPEPYEAVWAATVRAGGSWWDPVVTVGGRARWADDWYDLGDSNLGLVTHVRRRHLLSPEIDCCVMGHLGSFQGMLGLV